MSFLVDSFITFKIKVLMHMQWYQMLLIRNFKGQAESETSFTVSQALS